MNPLVKAKLISIYCRPILYYGIENMTITRAESKRIHSCEGIIIKKMLGLYKTTRHTKLMDALYYERDNIVIAKRKTKFL